LKSSLSDAQSTKVIAIASFTRLWLNLLCLIFITYRTTHRYSSSDRPIHCTLSQSVSKSHPPAPQFSISSKIYTDWTCVSAQSSITRQDIIITQFLITSFSIFIMFSQTAIFVQQLLFILYLWALPFF
jgi:hypothetical protein